MRKQNRSHIHRHWRVDYTDTWDDIENAGEYKHVVKSIETGHTWNQTKCQV